MEQPNNIIVKHTADKMKAFVALSGGSVRATANMVLTELLHKGIVHGLNTVLIGRLTAAALYDKYAEVAQGTPAKSGANGRIVLLIQTEDAGREGHAEGEAPKRLCDFMVVEAGAQLARRVPSISGADGMNIFGNPIPTQPVKDVELQGGDGTVCLPSDPNLLLAKIRGVFKQSPDGVISVEPYMEVDGDVGIDTGDISFAGHVKITGGINPGFAVNVTGSLMVLGAVEGAVIKCGGDLVMRSGVSGGESEIDCDGNVEAACLEYTALTAGGNVTIQKNIYRSNISAKGVVRAGGITGGNISAAGGIHAENIGSEGGRERTVLDISVIQGYIKEFQLQKNSLEAQIALSDGYISNLYRFVRDNMDEMGHIPEAQTHVYETHAKELTGSLAASRKIEEDIEKLETRLKETEECSIQADKIFPNVLMKLGVTEQNVTSILNNVHLKPSRMVI